MKSHKLIELLHSAPPDSWIAIDEASMTIVACEKSIDAVRTAADRKGFHDALVLYREGESRASSA